MPPAFSPEAQRATLIEQIQKDNHGAITISGDFSPLVPELHTCVSKVALPGTKISYCPHSDPSLSTGMFETLLLSKSCFAD